MKGLMKEGMGGLMNEGMKMDGYMNESMNE